MIMRNEYELQEHMQQSRQRLTHLMQFKRLMDDNAFQEFILNGYCDERLNTLVRTRSTVSDPNELNLIDRRIDSIGQFQHYLNQLQQEFVNIKQSLAETSELLHTDTTEDQ